MSVHYKFIYNISQKNLNVLNTLKFNPNIAIMGSKPHEVSPRSCGYSVYGQVIWKKDSLSSELRLMVIQTDVYALNRNIGETGCTK